MQKTIYQYLNYLLVMLVMVCCMCLNVHADDFKGFPKPDEDFQAHIAEVRAYLLRTQMSQRLPSDVEYNLPFERKADESVDYKGRFLLIHGLNDSPYVFTDVATKLTERGYDVRAILLPGHGNSPKAQLNMSSRRWIRSAREHLDLWQKQESSPIFLGGFSMGSVIATLLAVERKDISGLLLFSPAYQSSQNRLLRWAGIYSLYKPWVFGGMIREDNPAKYNSIPINGVAQYYKVTKALKRKWRRKKLDIPVLSIASIDDSVVDINYLTKKFNDLFVSDKRQLLIYANDNAVSLNDNALATEAGKLVTRLDEYGVVYTPSIYPELRVLNQSHQSVIMSPSNPLFGEAGSVLVCNGNEWPIFSACLFTNERRWYGAQHTPSPDGVPVARVTYNPDFDGVFEAFDKLFE